MGYHLATATLGPLLLLQGRHVRRVTPILRLADPLEPGLEEAEPGGLIDKPESPDLIPPLV